MTFVRRWTATILLAGLLIGVLSASACRRTVPVSEKPSAPEVTERVQAFLGGAAAAATLLEASDATTCQAFRIDPFGGKDDGADGKIRGHTITAGPVAVSAPQRAGFASVLGSDDTYLWDLAKGCEFLPGVALRYRGGSGSNVDVLLCFSCDELAIYTANGRVASEDFDPRRADLVLLVKELFPDDPKIQALKPTGKR